MKTNNFRVKEKKEDKIIIEEDHTKNALLLFFKKHMNLIGLLLIGILICSVLASVGIAFSLFRDTNNYDVSYIEGSDEIITNTDPTVDDEDIMEDLINKKETEETIVILVKTIMTDSGNVISYYSDGTVIMVSNTGKVYHVFPMGNGKYGVNEKGVINDKASYNIVSTQMVKLNDETSITYYNDGTAKVKLKDSEIYVKNSKNVKIKDGKYYYNSSPGDVALRKEIVKLENRNLFNLFTDNTSLIIDDDKSFLINKNVPATLNEGRTSVDYDSNNIYTKLSTKTLDDGNKLTYYDNGSATITDKDNNIIYVKKSGDIIIKDNKIYHIIKNNIGYSKSNRNTPDGTKVIYYDNGAATIEYTDGTRVYVEDSDDIIYNSSKNLTNKPTSSKMKSEGKTKDGLKAISYENGKTEIFNPDGTSYITDTSKVKLEEDKKEPSSNNKPSENKKDDEEEELGIEISDADSEYNEFKNLEKSTFIIKNTSTKKRRVRIVIEEIEDYNNRNIKRLEPKYVKFQASLQSEKSGKDVFVNATNLAQNEFKGSNGKILYVIYEGSISAMDSLKVSVSLYVDYEPLTNKYQNTAFIGNIKIYADAK